MRIEQLEAFLAVAETGSFQRAAEKCHVTQSTISRQVQALETELGLPLFHRSNYSKTTIAGERLLRYARKICQDWRNATKELLELREGKQPELCVAAIHSVCAYHLPKVLQKFCTDYPQVQLRVTALGSDRALKVLKDGLVDLAIIMNNRYLSNSTEMVVEKLFDEPIEVLMAADHPLAASELVSWAEIAPYPQVVFKHGYGMQRIIQEQFSLLGVSLHAALELNTPDAFRGVVRQSKMIALLPQSAMLEALSDPTLAVRSIITEPIKNHQAVPFSRQVVLVTTSDRLEIPPIQHFYQLVKQHLSQIST
jgi:DNA-binding transcriptional LysR family regulator